MKNTLYLVLLGSVVMAVFLGMFVWSIANDNQTVQQAKLTGQIHELSLEMVNLTKEHEILHNILNEQALLATGQMNTILKLTREIQEEQLKLHPNQHP